MVGKITNRSPSRRRKEARLRGLFIPQDLMDSQPRTIQNFDTVFVDEIVMRSPYSLDQSIFKHPTRNNNCDCRWCSCKSINDCIDKKHSCCTQEIFQPSGDNKLRYHK